MTSGNVTILGTPSPEEAAAVLAAVQVLLDNESFSAPQLPWSYRSAWRRAAITEGINRSDVS